MQLFDFDKNGWVVKQTASMNKQMGLLFLYDTQFITPDYYDVGNSYSLNEQTFGFEIVQIN